jgi:hypothetical protein
MNAPIKPHDFTEPLSKPNPIRRLLRVLLAIFSSPKGHQGGWEGGARGLSATETATTHQVIHALASRGQVHADHHRNTYA